MPTELNTMASGYVQAVTSYRKTYAEVLAAAVLEADSEKQALKMVQAGDLAKTLGRDASHDLAAVQRLARALTDLEADGGKAAKTLEVVQAKFSDHLIRRLESAVKSASGGDIKLLERAVVTAEAVMASIPGKADPATHLQRFRAEKEKLDEERAEAEASVEQVKNARLAIERAQGNTIFNTSADILRLRGNTKKK